MLEILCLSMDDGRQPKRLFLEASYGEMIRLDSTRVIGTSLEFLYGLEPPDYSFEILLETLADLSRISRGKFRPQNIVEIDKEIIQFNLNSKICSLVIEDAPDNPLTLAGQINPIIAETGYQFESYSNCRSNLLILLISEQEKQKIIPINGWEFENCWEHYAFIFNDRRSWY
ncbi:hypothetical protein PN466_05885 [Roseofilum reptotaenium CS-1145]|uniref:Uncharacterized protein n=1 Tax=Roseofilum reptotaenium AO1-A TaxID=1925591 RepID=A0A1L9QMK2_9CYAN|nr:hypothetical protein [Roseofilum reptotaenium]MDB9516484.1 hypothetical protein [Roseofilum reptotaenium CS-1145]OJJ22263.1 hypothetical protein BI308_19795 [Roseofilum reptotaenium AO1-A]